MRKWLSLKTPMMTWVESRAVNAMATLLLQQTIPIMSAHGWRHWLPIRCLTRPCITTTHTAEAELAITETYPPWVGKPQAIQECMDTASATTKCHGWPLRGICGTDLPAQTMTPPTRITGRVTSLHSVVTDAQALHPTAWLTTWRELRGKKSWSRDWYGYESLWYIRPNKDW